MNAGSTSLKLSALAPDETSTPVGSLEDLPVDIVAVAHRVVHGGQRFREPVVIDDRVERELVDLAELAPLHNRHALAEIAEARKALPGVPHVAVFDTAFHATMPEEASVYALPRQWREEWGIRRYGFHGLSVQWAAEQAPVSRLVVCHLGGGCSVTAVLDGRSVDTTMGFSPLEGVPMTTRSGSVDVEAVLHLLRSGLLDLEEAQRQLEQESGLRGLSGGAGARELEERSDPVAQLALGVFSLRVAGAVAAMAVALGGIDTIVFTAGIGENSVRVRREVCERLRFLGVKLDSELNVAGRPDSDVSSAESAVRVVLAHAREDVIAARAARSLLQPV